MISFFLYTIFIISYFLHMTARIPTLGVIRFDLLLMVFTVISIVFGRTREAPKDLLKPEKLLIAFVIFVLLEIPFVAYPGSVINYGFNNFMKGMSFFFFTIYIIDNETKLKWFMGGLFFCQLVRIIEPFYLHQTAGYWGDVAFSMGSGALTRLNRLSSGPFDVLNATQFAWLIVSSLIFFYYLLWEHSKKGKLLFLGVAPAAVYTLLLTGARSGLVCLFLVILQVLFYQERRGRAIVVGLLLLVPSGMYASMTMSDAMKTRYMSLVKKDVAGSDTASGRVEGLKKNFSTIMSRPIFGHGLGTTREVNANTIGSTQPSHNMYVEVLQETGLVGFFLFMAYIKALLLCLYKLRNQIRGKPSAVFLFNLTTALIVWMQMHLVYGLSCFSLKRWDWYLTGGLAVVCMRLSKNLRESSPLKKNDPVLG